MLQQIFPLLSSLLGKQCLPSAIISDVRVDIEDCIQPGTELIWCWYTPSYAMKDVVVVSVEVLVYLSF